MNTSEQSIASCCNAMKTNKLLVLLVLTFLNTSYHSLAHGTNYFLRVHDGSVCMNEVQKLFKVSKFISPKVNEITLGLLAMSIKKAWMFQSQTKPVRRPFRPGRFMFQQERAKEMGKQMGENLPPGVIIFIVVLIVGGFICSMVRNNE